MSLGSFEYTTASDAVLHYQTVDLPVLKAHVIEWLRHCVNPTPERLQAASLSSAAARVEKTARTVGDLPEPLPASNRHLRRVK